MGRASRTAGDKELSSNVEHGTTMAPCDPSYSVEFEMFCLRANGRRVGPGPLLMPSTFCIVWESTYLMCGRPHVSCG